MRKYFISIFLVTSLLFLLFDNYGHVRDFFLVQNKDEITYNSRVDDKYFSLFKFGLWKRTFITGVNIGAGKPGYFPGEHGITKEDYLRWFKYIEDLNVNSIRIYTLLSPDFYEALYEHNKNSIKPLYVFHGVWVNEEKVSKYEDAYNPDLKEDFTNEIKQIIDVIHGNADIPVKKGHAGGKYSFDISNYVIGWILGIEWDPYFVIGTNEKNPDKTNYNGEYLYSKDCSPFEVFLTEIGDMTIEYETKSYGYQRPLSFTNWVTTDMLSHPNEPLEKEDLVTVNTEHIKYKDAFKCGLFASYHIYPYYPDFMNYQEEYKNFKDDKGNVNTYKAYLRDLRKQHNIPVLVAEYGVPSSRGMAHKNIHMDFNQGKNDETKQGIINNYMLKDIVDEGYAGALVFTWQDEWFKRTWNTMDYDLPERRPFWSNVETNEQMFGILAFDPGQEKSICDVDGDYSEWIENKDKSSTKDDNLYIRHDERYVYFLIKSEYLRNNCVTYIPIDIKPNQGNTSYTEDNLGFKSPIEVLIKIDKNSDSRILIDAYYDSFSYHYGKLLGFIDYNYDYSRDNTGIFTPIYLALNREIFLPVDKVSLPFEKYEAGKLLSGNGNPKSKEYNSLTDYAMKDNVLEIRIPWALLNVMDPSQKIVMDDLYKYGIKPYCIEGFYSGLIILSEDKKQLLNNDMTFYSWNNWEEPQYHERLKKSYYVMKDYYRYILKYFKDKLGE